LTKDYRVWPPELKGESEDGRCVGFVGKFLAEVVLGGAVMCAYYTQRTQTTRAAKLWWMSEFFFSAQLNKTKNSQGTPSAW
jgi:hypothetical protein